MAKKKDEIKRAIRKDIEIEKKETSFKKNYPDLGDQFTEEEIKEGTIDVNRDARSEMGSLDGMTGFTVSEKPIGVKKPKGKRRKQNPNKTNWANER